MRVKISKLYTLLFLVGVSTLIGVTVLSGYNTENIVADIDMSNSENQMFTEKRRGYDIEIRSSEPSERSGIRVFSGRFPANGEVETSDNTEVLLIDGEVIPYSKTTEGYRIYYQPPTPDLPSAARSYVDTQPEK